MKPKSLAAVGCSNNFAFHHILAVAPNWLEPLQARVHLHSQSLKQKLQCVVHCSFHSQGELACPVSHMQTVRADAWKGRLEGSGWCTVWRGGGLQLWWCSWWSSGWKDWRTQLYQHCLLCVFLGSSLGLLSHLTHLARALRRWQQSGPS